MGLLRLRRFEREAYSRALLVGQVVLPPATTVMVH